MARLPSLLQLSYSGCLTDPNFRDVKMQKHVHLRVDEIWYYLYFLILQLLSKEPAFIIRKELTFLKNKIKYFAIIGNCNF